MRIPMMPISQSDLMPISSERSDAGLPQCELVIGIRQGFLSVGAIFHSHCPPGVAGRLLQ
jgi:hypothetical protein